MAPVSPHTQTKSPCPDPWNKSTFFDGAAQPPKCPNFWGEQIQCLPCPKKMKMRVVKLTRMILHPIPVKKEGKKITGYLLCTKKLVENALKIMKIHWRKRREHNSRHREPFCILWAFWASILGIFGRDLHLGFSKVPKPIVGSFELWHDKCRRSCHEIRLIRRLFVDWLGFCLKRRFWSSRSCFLAGPNLSNGGRFLRPKGCQKRWIGHIGFCDLWNHKRSYMPKGWGTPGITPLENEKNG